MKKFNQVPYMALILGVTLFSCSGNKQPEADESLRWDSIVKDTIIHLTTDNQSPTAEIHLNIKYADGKQAKSINDSILRSGILSPDYLSITDKKMSVQEAIDTFTTKYLADYKRDFGAMYSRDKEHGASYNLQYSCNTRTSEEKEGVLNYVAEVFSYSGGAHGMNFTLARNIDKATAKVMKINDFFVPGYEENLKELIVEKLCKQFDVKDLDGLRAKSIFYGIEPYVPGNFIVRKDSFVFIFCDTEIAPHAIGEIRLSIDNSELKQILKKDS